jgi:hypothetical protein
MANVFATEAGQFLYGAHRYLSAARLLRFSGPGSWLGRWLPGSPLGCRPN